MKVLLSITVLALAALSQSANGHEWMCQGVQANVTSDLVTAFQKCHAEASEQDADVPEDEQKLHKFYETKCCMWKDDNYMVIDKEGNFDWDKLKTMVGHVFGNGVGEAVIDKAKEHCHDKMEGAKCVPKDPKGLELVKCLIHTMHVECEKKE